MADTGLGPLWPIQYVSSPLRDAPAPWLLTRCSQSVQANSPDAAFGGALPSCSHARANAWHARRTARARRKRRGCAWARCCPCMIQPVRARRPVSPGAGRYRRSGCTSQSRSTKRRNSASSSWATSAQADRCSTTPRNPQQSPGTGPAPSAGRRQFLRGHKCPETPRSFWGTSAGIFLLVRTISRPMAAYFGTPEHLTVFSERDHLMRERCAESGRTGTPGNSAIDWRDFASILGERPPSGP